MEEKQWFLYISDRQEGPFTEQELKGILKEKNTRAAGYVWKEGLADWVMMSDVPEFAILDSESGEGHGQPAIVAPPSNLPNEDEFEVSIGNTGPDDIAFCLKSNNTYSGPHSLRTIIRKLKAEEISITDQVWKEGWTKFFPLSLIGEVVSQISSKNSEATNMYLKRSQTQTLSTPTMATKSISQISVPRKKWYRRGPLALLMLVIIPVFAYQFFATGGAPALIAMTPLKGHALTPIPLDSVGSTVSGIAEQISSRMTPVLGQFVDYVPTDLQKYFSPIPRIEGVSTEQIHMLRDAASKSIAEGASLAVARADGDDFTPEFYISSNLPDGATVSLTLVGKEGTLLNVPGYRRNITLDLQKKMAKSIRFTFEGDKSLPRGEYSLLASVQNGSLKTSQALDLFLGGKNDATYRDKLKEYNSKVSAKKNAELMELGQMLDFIESSGIEDAKSLTFALSQKNTLQKQAYWKKHNDKFQKMIGQLRTELNKSPEVFQRDYTKGDLYLKLKNLESALSELHNKRGQSVTANSPALQSGLHDAEGVYAAELQSMKELLGVEKSK